MKKNMSRTMDKLEIDEDARDLIRQMWKHGYRTLYGCAGHAPKKYELYELDEETGKRKCVEKGIEFNTKYITYEKGTGDGWFEKEAKNLGFISSEEGILHEPRIKDEVIKVKSIGYYANDIYAKKFENGTLQINNLETLEILIEK